MIRKSKNRAGWACFAMSATLLAGCGGGGADRVYDLSVGDARSKISSTKSEYSTSGQTRSMSAAGSTGDGLRVRLSHAGSFANACVVRFEAVGDAQTRITPDCGGTGSATGETLMASFEMEIDAHVRKILTGEPIDGQALARRQLALTAKNAGSIISEGGQDSELASRASDAAIRRVENEQDGWGDDAAAADGWAN